LRKPPAVCFSCSRDLHSLAVEQFKLDHNSPTVRRLFRALDRGFNSLTYENAMLKAENAALKQSSAQSKKRKKAPVERDLNKLFVTVQNVRNTRQRVESPESSRQE
jgi:hypothetical protein